ncbi:MAG: 4-hydroxy-tetrahydrodipicolinate synthase [Oceanospirillales bacterium TMED33]|nr:4-hydroxy-tetrahydrodipicolinate synthase [Gammaproteobacteria bacterium]RPG22067.1 MAG: 4-hydroxy-tetrahydrodipicolinate synthase [Oceanospirillales bacterium TMED33]CAI8344799.1 MAG: 4-hydroxy-tetrahydrodipicolinate synthase [Gammaproteobacteria bacterium]
MIRGSIVALVTPFNASGGVDYGALENLIEFHVTEGTHAIVAVGTTGESATLSHSEDNEVIKATVEHVGGRIPVIAGAGSNSTAEACQLTEAATRAGADAILSVAPYYNKPPQNGLLAHFKAVADNTDLPIILYNVPGRTVTDIADETTLELAQVANIAGIKDATGDLERAEYVLKHRPEGFAVYSGDDPTAMELCLLGGDGDISVTANVAPRLMAMMVEQAMAGNRAEAEALNNQLLGLHSKLFVEPNPIPSKWALSEMGLMRADCRLPLVPLTDEGKVAVREACKLAGIGL